MGLILTFFIKWNWITVSEELFPGNPGFIRPSPHSNSRSPQECCPPLYSQGGTKGGEAELSQHHHILAAGNSLHGNIREELHNTKYRTTNLKCRPRPKSNSKEACIQFCKAIFFNCNIQVLISSLNASMLSLHWLELPPQ